MTQPEPKNPPARQNLRKDRNNVQTAATKRQIDRQTDRHTVIKGESF